MVILAGGKGQRIGGGKPHVLFDGQRLIDHAMDLVSSWNCPIVISVHEPRQVEQDRFPEIVDRTEVVGPLAGLLAAFAWAQKEALAGFLTLPCDMPRLPVNCLARLQSGSEAADRPTVACCGERRHPVCAFWPVSYFDGVVAYAQTGRQSLFGALEATEAIDVYWPKGDEDLFFNINQPHDLVGPRDCRAR
ncbi:MAG: molybdenum cofactor guanylyltransferase [Alphaproteobacteria bacterium]|nr:molybdenum cofactor guanylyltransferase [Alphaproteobacteria bacterium]